MIDERIEFVNETKFTKFSSENKIHERQYIMFIIIALFSSLMRYNNFIKRTQVIRIKRKNQCFVISQEKSSFFFISNKVFNNRANN